MHIQSSFSTCRFSGRNTWAKWSAGALMAMSGLSAQAQQPLPVVTSPVAKAYNRNIDMEVGGLAQSWYSAKDYRLSQWQQDLKEIKQGRAQLAEAIKAIDAASDPVSQAHHVRKSFKFNHFFGFLTANTYREEKHLRQQYHQAREIQAQRDGMKQGLDFLKSVQEGRQAVSQTELETAQTAQTAANEALKQADEAFTKASKGLDYRRSLIFQNGRVMTPQEKAAYVKEMTEYSETKGRYFAAIQEQILRQQAVSVLSTLTTLPEEQQAAKCAELEAGMQVAIQSKDAELFPLKPALEDDYYARLSTYYALYDKLGMLWKNPTGELRVVLGKEEVLLAKNMMQLYLDTHADHPDFVAKTVETLQQNPGVDLRIDTDKAPNPWPRNIMVGSAADQETVAFGDYYFNQLMAELPQAKSLSKAVMNLAGKSLYLAHVKNNAVQGHAWQNPQVSSRTVHGWDTQEKGVTRKVLIIAGATFKRDGEQKLSRANRVKDTLKDKFSLKDEDVTILHTPTLERVSKAFDALKAQQDETGEVMVILLGHGAGAYFDAGMTPEQRFMQGSARGAFVAQVDENDVTQVWLNEDFLKKEAEKLSGFKSGLFLVLSCHSGAWIAAHEPGVPAGETNPFVMPDVFLPPPPKATA